MNHFNRFLIVISLELILFILQVNAQTSVFINTNKDCYTWSAQPNQNQNGNYLVVENNSANNSYAPSLIYFNISSIPQNATIVNAYILLYRWDDTGSPILRFGRLQGDVTWTETGVTYNNMPYPTTPPPFEYINVGNPNTYSAYDVTEFVQEWHAGGYTNNGFSVFTESQNTGALFYAHEYGSSRTPKLNVVYEVPLTAPILESPPNGTTILANDPVDLDWNNVPGADYYDVHVVDSGGFDVVNTTSTPSSYTIPMSLPLDTYYWQIRARNSSGPGPWSDWWSFTIVNPPPCDLSQTNDIPNPVSYSGGSYTLSITLTGTNCNNWDITKPGWILVNPANGGNGTTNVDVTVISNSSTIPRNGTITITSTGSNGSPINITVNQDGMPQPCDLSQTNDIPNPVPGSGGSYTLSITLTGTNCNNWAITKPGWILVNPSNGGNGTTNVAVTVTSNSLTSPRNGTITITSTGSSGSPINITVNQDGTTGIISMVSKTPEEYSLDQNFPNPFNPYTNIEFSLKDESYTTLTVYDISGKEVQSLLNNESLPTGIYRLNFDASDLPSGIYFYRLQAGSFVETKKMILLR